MIFYFSGTGNTRWAAEYLARHTGEKLIFIPDEPAGECRYVPTDGERIGFCFPVHGWQPPRIVRDFISRLVIEHPEKHYCYALCTCGDNIGEAMGILDKDLAARQLHAESVFSLIMPESYVCLPFMYTDTAEREKEKIEAAEKELEAIARIVTDRVKGAKQLEKGATPWIYSYVIGGYFNRFMITDKPFLVDAGTCIKCGKCVSVCPTGNVTGGKGDLPDWKHDGSCTCCLACYHHCPAHAINYGKITRRRGQYYFKSKNNTTE